MAELPDELWMRILELGASSYNPNRLTFKDLCCLSISSRRLRRLSNDGSLWSSLLCSDFPSTQSASSSYSSNVKACCAKSLYQARYERDKARRIASHGRAVLRIESRISERSRRLCELQAQREEEAQKIKAVASELSNLHKVRQASTALNVWQPEIIWGTQKQIVEQCPVPVESRMNALQMELKLCKQQINVFEKAFRDESLRLEAAKEQLSFMKYHPLHDYLLVDQRISGHGSKRKKLKECSTC